MKERHRRASRREFLGLLSAAALWPRDRARAAPPAGTVPAAARPLRVRAITAGVDLDGPGDVATIEKAIAVLGRAREALVAAGNEVQTLRVATQPLFEAGPEKRRRSLAALASLDAAAVAGGVVLSVGPVLTSDEAPDDFAAWASELATSTKRTSFTVMVASPDRGSHPRAAAAAARAIVALAQASPVANFRFAAAARVPPGSPFFPVAYHRGPRALSVGLESAHLVEEAFAGAAGPAEATVRLRQRLNVELRRIEGVAAAFARAEGWAYGGIDPSPAPGMDRSIGAAVEALIEVPFGSPSTLQACAAVTDALKSLDVRTCGYAGLMLPVAEDPVLARRAREGRYGIEELLLYSSVCGTGLDVVPIPGDTPAEVVEGIVSDVASLSVKLQKPLSARLFPVVGKKAGEVAHFDDPLLTDTVVFDVG
ncbi:MAG TPA: DUF711 family protein [Vicinamibacteria bacterium]|nr:DUF711 family protein [Vicinamibacteria bacterium]